MAKPKNELKLVSNAMSLHGESFTRTELVKAPSGMLFKLSADVHNCSNSWNIYAWSNALGQWSMVASMDDIPGIKYLSYLECKRNELHPVAAQNWKMMKDFIIKFVDALA